VTPERRGHPPALAITGATTSGKTEVALEVAQRLRGEIISMDSRQLYRGMDIGTDTATRDARSGVPHHGLDLVDPDARYSAGQFARDARRWIGEIHGRGHIPILAGGTGFFLRALIEPVFQEPEMDSGQVERLRAALDQIELRELERWVAVLDPDRAEVAIGGGRQRVTRTLEVALLTGRPLSHWHAVRAPDGDPVPCLVVVLDLDRAELDRRINARVDRMIERGLVQEVQTLLDQGYGPDDPGMTGTGYREIIQVIRGTRSLEDALDEMKRQTRRYARRQLTWFRHQLPEDAVWLAATLTPQQRVEQIVHLWNELSEDLR